MRAFVGLDLSFDMKNQISAVQKRVKSFSLSGRWKRMENFHLTLKFLDEVENSLVPHIGNALGKLCSDMPRFRLKIGEMGYFPGKDCLRVLWLGLDGDLKHLYDLQAGVEKRLQSLGFEKEKRLYKPHLTIAQDVVLSTAFEEMKKHVSFDSLPVMDVQKITLFKSEQIGYQRVYTPIIEHVLAGAE